MDRQEARALLMEEVNRYRSMLPAELRALIGEAQVKEIKGASGSGYTIETDVFWDDKQQTTLRVMSSIDDGGLSAWLPMTENLLVPCEPAKERQGDAL
jgi:hypothetical protein